MPDLSNIFASTLTRQPTARLDRAAGARPRAVEAAVDSKAVLQLNSTPYLIDLTQFKDAYSADHPTGDYLPAYRFRNLSNPIPFFTRYYDLSGNTIEKIWGNIVWGAEATTEIARHLLSSARMLFDNYKLSNLAGIPDPWLPVGAWPSNWFDLVNHAPQLRLDIGQQGLSASDFYVIGNEDQLVWQNKGEGKENREIPLGGRVRQISLRALKVSFLREWLDFQILSMGNWKIRGFREGFYSSGDPINNDGVFPLLPTTIIVGTEVTVEGEWSAADRTVVESHLKQAEPLSLGPFPLVCAGSDASEIDSTGAIRSRVAHIVGYISNLVPFAPQSTDLIRGSVLVKNNGAFVARFSVQYRQGGRTTASESGNFPALSGKDIDIPSAATNIALKIEIMTFPSPFETWKTVATYQFDKPATKCYELSGTTFSPTIAEIDCPA